MFKLVVVVQTLPEKAEAFEEMVRPLIENSRREKGNISYDVLDFAESVNGYIAAPLVLYRVEPKKVSLF